MSRLIAWSDAFSVGVPEIDHHHSVLIGLLNELHEAVHRRKGARACREALERLRRCAITHFAVEEKLMRAGGYPEFRENLITQEELLRHLDTMLERVEDENTNITFHGLHVLKVRVLQHVRQEDTPVEDEDDARPGSGGMFARALKRA